jgi:hypothetical protein
MTEQEEKFIHFVSCIRWLNNAWCLLNTIKKDRDNPLIVPAFRFALIEYSKAYKLSHGVTQKFNLDRSCIPSQLHALHEQIIGSRDQVHAHSDLTVMDAKLYVHEFKGQRYTIIPQNRITGGEELPNINEIIRLIEATLDNMYIKEKELENALPTQNE